MEVQTNSGMVNPLLLKQPNIAASLEISLMGSPLDSLKEGACHISWSTTAADALSKRSLRPSQTSFEVVCIAGIPATTDFVHFILM